MASAKPIIRQISCIGRISR